MVLTVKFDVFENGVNRRKGGASVASGEVHIHKGDSAVRLARDFCKRYGLDESEVALPLAEHIEVRCLSFSLSPCLCLSVSLCISLPLSLSFSLSPSPFVLALFLFLSPSTEAWTVHLREYLNRGGIGIKPCHTQK